MSLPSSMARSQSSPSDESFARWLESRQAFFILIAACGAVLWILLFLQFTVDDAYISFRYAKNLVNNHVWNWNPSGSHVEAYTSASYTVLAILPTILHFPVPLFFKLVGLLCVAAMLYRVFTESDTRLGIVLSCLVVGMDARLWIHAFSGLETPLYMLLIVEMALCVKHAHTVKPSYVSAVFLLLPLTRPEGIVFALAGAFLILRHRPNQAKLLGWLGAATLLGAMYFVARWHYFGQLLPNPFYVKVAQASLAERLLSFRDNLNSSKFTILILLLVGALVQRLYIRVFAACSLILLMTLFEPHLLIMNYAERFFFQLTLPIVLLFFTAIDLQHISKMACTVAVLVILSSNSLTSGGGELRYFPYLIFAHIDLGKRLAPFAAQHTMLIGDDGAVPYYSNWVTYDSLGLCTNVVARHGVTPGFLHSIHPDLIVLYNDQPGPDLIWPNDQTTIVEYMRSSGEYEYAGTSRWAQFNLVEFLRKDIPQHDEIARALNENTKISAQDHFSFKKLLEQKYVPLQ